MNTEVLLGKLLASDRGFDRLPVTVRFRVRDAVGAALGDSQFFTVPQYRLKHRWWHWLKALLTGYFWLPCPICGQKFGGHEWVRGTLFLSPEGRGVCPACAPLADRISERVLKVLDESWDPSDATWR